MSDITLKFNEAGKFKILCFADLHMNERNTAKGTDTVTLMSGAIEKLAPDLVVFLGDNVTHWDEMTPEGLDRAFDAIIGPVREKRIPLAVVFGNHDHQTDIPLLEQLKKYQAYDLCLAEKGTCENGVGNYNVTIKCSSGKRDVFNLWFIDSGDNVIDENGHKPYNYVRDDQIAWYEDTAAALKEKNGGFSLPALLFQHIPVPEEYRLLKEVSPLTPFAVKGQCAWNKKYYLIAEPQFTIGYLGEGPCPPDFNNGQFESWKKTGDILGAVFGHDHINDFCGALEGISLMQVRGAGFHTYGDGQRRGVRLITLDESDLTTFTTQTLFFKDVTDDKRCLSVVGFDNLSRKQKKALRDGFSIGGAAAAAVSAVGVTIAALVKRNKK